MWIQITRKRTLEDSVNLCNDFEISAQETLDTVADWFNLNDAALISILPSQEGAEKARLVFSPLDVILVTEPTEVAQIKTYLEKGQHQTLDAFKREVIGEAVKAANNDLVRQVKGNGR